MKAPFSAYLDSITPYLREVVRILSEKYDYVSVLSTDSTGFSLAISQHSKSVSNANMTTERGNVVRVAKDGRYSEFAWNLFEAEKPEETAKKIEEAFDAENRILSAAGTETYITGILEDEPLTLFVEKEAGILPEEADMESLVSEFVRLSDRGMETVPGAIECMLRGSSTHICKMFLTKNRYLRQSYVYTEAICAAIAPTEKGES